MGSFTVDGYTRQFVTFAGNGGDALSAADLDLTTASYTLAVVARLDALPARQVVGGLHNSYVLGYNAGQAGVAGGCGTVYGAPTDASTEVGSWAMWVEVADTLAGLRTLWRNGVLLGNVTAGSGGGSGCGPHGLVLGGSGAGGSTACSIGEVVVFGTPLAATSRQAVEGYLGVKWGAQLLTALPLGHPYRTMAAAGVAPSATVSSSALPTPSAAASAPSASTASNNDTATRLGVQLGASVAGAIVAGCIGLLFWRLRMSWERAAKRREHPFASRLRDALRLSLDNFATAEGRELLHAADALSARLTAHGVATDTAHALDAVAPLVAAEVAARVPRLPAAWYTCACRRVAYHAAAIESAADDVAAAVAAHLAAAAPAVMPAAAKSLPSPGTTPPVDDTGVELVAVAMPSPTATNTDGDGDAGAPLQSPLEPAPPLESPDTTPAHPLLEESQAVAPAITPAAAVPSPAP